MLLKMMKLCELMGHRSLLVDVLVDVRVIRRGAGAFPSKQVPALATVHACCPLPRAISAI